MFNTYLHTEEFQKPDENIFFMAARNGLFKGLNNPFYEAVVPAKSAKPTDCVPRFKLKLPKLPFAMLQEIDAFFAAVYEKYKGEAIVLLAASPARNEWRVVCPKQVTKGLAVSYTLPDPIGLPDDFKIFGSIHSHAGISAFHSGTDTSDEHNSDGLHAVLGHYDRPQRDMCACMVIHGHRFGLKVEDWLEMPGLGGAPVEQTWFDSVSGYEPPPRSAVQDEFTSDALHMQGLTRWARRKTAANVFRAVAGRRSETRFSEMENSIVEKSRARMLQRCLSDLQEELSL